MSSTQTIPRFCKYVTFETAIKILEDKTLMWSTPDSFNDPFEFKSPFEYGFDWDEMKEIALRRFATILTQIEEPNLFPGNPVASKIPERRLECKGRDPGEVSNRLRPKVESLVERLKEPSIVDRKFWLELKQTYLFWIACRAIPPQLLLCSLKTPPDRRRQLVSRPGSVLFSVLSQRV